MNVKKIEKVQASKSVGTGPSSYEKRIYRAAVSQKLRNAALCKPQDIAGQLLRDVPTLILTVMLFLEIVLLSVASVTCTSFSIFVRIHCTVCNMCWLFSWHRKYLLSGK